MYSERVSTENTEESIGYYMTVDEFLSSVSDGMFTDYDGHGHPCLGDMMDPRLRIYPSRTHAIPVTATHIMWFNK